MKVNIIVATCNNNGIGLNNELPWNTINNDMQLFAKLTKGKGNNAIIMGKNTFLSIDKYLPNRTNIVISKSLSNYLLENDKFIIYSNIKDTINYCIEEKFDEVWIIGGSKIYNEFLKLNIIDKIYQTQIYQKYDCDTFFPEIPLNYNIESIHKICKKTPCILLIWKNKKISHYYYND